MSDELPRHALRKLLDVAREGDAAEASWRARFRIVGELGRGGMGVVYEAWDDELGRPVALKVLSDRVAVEPTSRERFEREALTAARLTHPNIAAVFDAWHDAIAMQLIRGITLADGGRPRDRAVCVRLVRDAARAVHYAHERGIVHRDIKPHNLMLEDDRVVVTDFGLAKTAGDPSMSTTGGILGTPSYMSPEQARGQGRFAGPTTDVWGLGATLHFLLTGEAPFRGQHAVEVLLAVCEDEAPRAGVDRDLDLVVATCMEKDASRRYATAADLAEDLDRWLAKRPVLARPPTISYRLSKFVRRRRAAVVVTVAFAVIAAVVLAVMSQHQARQRAADDALVLARRVDAVIDDWALQRGSGDVEAARLRLAEGIASCRDFLDRHGDVANAYFLLGRLLRFHGRLDDAREALDAALELDPELVEARVERGLLVAGRISERAAERDPPTPVTEMRELFADDYDLAVADLAIAAASSTRLRRSDALHVEAEAARLRGDRTAARRAYVGVLDLDPLRTEITRALLRLDLEEGHHDAAWWRAMSAIDIERGLGRAYSARRVGVTRAPDAAGPTVVDLGTESAFVSVDTQWGGGDAAAYAGRAMAAVRRAVDRRRAGDASEAAVSWTEAVADLETALRLDEKLAAARINVNAARIELARTHAALGRRSASRDLLALVLEDLGEKPGAGEHDAVRTNREVVRRLADGAR